MHVTMTITLSEIDARRLWQRMAEQEGEPPTGQDLADWLAEFSSTTIESNFQFDASVFVNADAEGHTNTLGLLRELHACDEQIGDGNSDAPEINAAKERRDEIKSDLLLSDEPEQSEEELEELLAAYAPRLAITKPTAADSTNESSAQ